MKKLILILVALLLFPMHLLGAVAPRPMPQRAPADAMVYVGWQGTDKLQAQYQGSRLQAVLGQSTLPQFVQTELPKLLQQMGHGSDDAKVIIQALSTAGMMTRYPTAIYIGAMDFSRPMPDPRIALICDAGQDAPAITTQLATLMEPVIRNSPFEIKVTRADACVLVTLGTLTEESTNLLTDQGPGASVAMTKEFQNAMAQVQKDPALVVYVNFPAIFQNVEAAMAKAPPRVLETWKETKTALNLGGLGTAVYAASFDGKDWLEQAFVGTTGPRTGVLALLDAKPLAPDIFKTIPATATYAAATHFDINRLYTEAMTILSRDNDELRGMKRDVDRALAELRQKTGLDLQKDLLAPLGDQWAVYSAPGVGGNSLFGLAVVSPVKDAATLEKAFSTLRTKTRRQLTSEEQEEQAMMRGFEPDFSLRHGEIAGVPMDYINLFVVAPSWSVKNGHLFIGLQPQTIPSAVDQLAAGSSLADAPGYQAILQRLAVKNPTMIQYIDLPRVAPDGYQNLVQLVTVINTVAGDKVPPSILPPLSKLMPQLSPMGWASWVDDAGWHCKGITPFPGAIILGGQQMGMMGASMSPALMMGIMLPSLGRARTMAEASSDAANLHSIAQSSIVYAIGESDNFPDHPAQLVAAGQIAPRTLVVKSSGTTPLVPTQEQLEAARKDWHDLAKNLDAHCDYVYLGKGMKNTSDATIVLAYTKPEASPRRTGLNVAFSDGHVEFISLPDLRQNFEATNKARKELSLPEIKFNSNGFPIAPEEPAEKK